MSELAKDKAIKANTTHQAIDKIGDGLVISACAPDVIVEVVESKDYKFLVGAQWHSEYP